MSGFAHLDHWRIRPVSEGELAFGPVQLAPRFNAIAGAFVAALAATPRHGMLWSDAEARGFIDAQVGREVSRRVRQINAPWRAAVCARAGVDRYVAPLVRSVASHGKGTPMCVAINSGAAWAEVFLAAIEGGISNAELRRFNALTGLQFTKRSLAKPDDLSIRYCRTGDLYIDWRDRTAHHPLRRALYAMSLINGDTPSEWGYLRMSFGWGWLQDRQRFAASAREHLGEDAARRLLFSIT